MIVYTRQLVCAFVILTGVLAAFGQVVAGLLYEQPLIFLTLYVLRESWLFAAAVILFLILARSVIGKEITIQSLLVMTVYVVFAAFILLIGLSERTPSIMVIFLQFRNLFGFALAIVFVAAVRPYLDSDLLFRAGLVISVLLIAYSYLELALLFKNGYLISNEFFNKELLEEAKGTRADVGGGVFGALRIPGPLFNPSQLGMFAVYLVYAGTAGARRFNVGLVLLLISVVLLGFSKSAFVMVFMVAVLRLLGRQVALLVLLGFLFAPFILGMVEGIFSDYHLASVSRHFQGYLSAVQLLADKPFGSGVGSAGELASTLGGFEARAGFESGMGTIITNLGVLGVLLYMVSGLFCLLQSRHFYFDMFALWSVSMYFNESAMSPHLFVFQFCMVGCLVASQTKQSAAGVEIVPLRNSVGAT